jgi:hypothetical protein
MPGDQRRWRRRLGVCSTSLKAHPGSLRRRKIRQYPDDHFLEEEPANLEATRHPALCLGWPAPARSSRRSRWGCPAVRLTTTAASVASDTGGRQSTQRGPGTTPPPSRCLAWSRARRRTAAMGFTGGDVAWSGDRRPSRLPAVKRERVRRSGSFDATSPRFIVCTRCSPWRRIQCRARRPRRSEGGCRALGEEVAEAVVRDQGKVERADASQRRRAERVAVGPWVDDDQGRRSGGPHAARRRAVWSRPPSGVGDDYECLGI